MDKRIKTIIEGQLGARPSWDEYFMHTAIGIASRSSCHHVHSGTIIVANKQIIGEGYNGAPSKIEHNCIETDCRKKLRGLDYQTSLNSASCIGVHSEINALGHLSKLSPLKISIYTTIFPCHTCAKNMLSYDIEKIVFKSSYSEHEMPQTLDLFGEANIPVCQLKMSLERDMDIRYNHIEVDFDVWSKEDKGKFLAMIRD